MEDNVLKRNFTQVFRSFTEDLFATGSIMVFRPVTNQDKVESTATVSDGIWIGSGTIVGGDAAYVQTIPISGIDHVIATSSNAEFLCSADGGETWRGYTVEGWVEDAYMTRNEIQAITAEEWTELGERIIVRAVIEADASLSTLNCYGAYVPEEE